MLIKDVFRQWYYNFFCNDILNGIKCTCVHPCFDTDEGSNNVCQKIITYAIGERSGYEYQKHMRRLIIFFVTFFRVATTHPFYMQYQMINDSMETNSENGIDFKASYYRANKQVSIFVNYLLAG